MKPNHQIVTWMVAALLLADLPSPAGEPVAKGESASTEAKSGSEPKEASSAQMATIPTAASQPVVVTNTVSIGGHKIVYRSETGMLPLLNEDGEARASVFYVAYTRLEIPDPAGRPVMFCFNGGPGSSSVWLHLGGLGPRRVVLNDDGTMPPPPFALEDNRDSILAATDLVFIDPVATGYSRPGKDKKPEEFFGQSADVRSVGGFIRLWTTRHERWLSPKYLCGESYGVFRAVGLAEYLHSRYGMYFNGLVLMSGVLDFATLREGPGNELPFVVFLPAMTAAAHYHKKLPPDLQGDLDAALQESRGFARDPYARALLQSRTLPDAERRTISTELARLTGLPRPLIVDHDLRISSEVFREYLLRDEGLVIGRFDARITGRDADKSSPAPRFDPSYSSVYGPFAAAMNDYVRRELRFTNDLPYEILTGVKPWDFDAVSSYPSVTERLASVMSQNPYLRVLVLAGLCDLATPMDGMRYSLDHLRIDPGLRTNIAWAEYQSGHMMYVNRPDLVKLRKDLEKFLRP